MNEGNATCHRVLTCSCFVVWFEYCFMFLLTPKFMAYRNPAHAIKAPLAPTNLPFHQHPRQLISTSWRSRLLPEARSHLYPTPGAPEPL